ncbi:MAG: HlyC/CorC family transporter [Myxococcales bacterium]|nr:HlyC/CorC family transporter [Myxococcales bacterium]
MEQYLYLALAFLLVLLNGFFVATEFAIVKVRPTQLKALAEKGRPGASNALKVVERLDSYLSATQFGITLASLGLGWLGEPAFARIIEPLVRRLVPDAAQASQLAHSAALVISFSIITFLHIVVGELAPKSLAIQKAESTALSVAWPIRAFHLLFYPGIWLLNGMARLLLGLMGLRPTAQAHEAHSEEELRVILASSAQAGAIATQRAELLERALSMVSKTGRQVMVPRSQIFYLDLEESLEKNIAEARAAGHTYLPVCRGNLDRVEGVVNVKDLFFLLSRGELKSITQVQRPVLFVPENVTLEQLLAEFRRRKKQMAVVVDEHGGTSGIVTIADVVAEVVGEVAELGRKVEPVQALPGGKLELPGTAQLDDLEYTLETEFDVDHGEVTTIGGYLMAKLRRIPLEGDRVGLDRYDVQVVKMDGPRVVTVRVEPKQEPAAPAPA